MKRRNFVETSLASAFALSSIPFLSGCTKTEKPKQSGISPKYKLKFNSDGKFKIVQFTDIHWKNGTENCDKTLKILGSVLDAEKPDLIIFTGDIAVSNVQKDAYDAVSKLAIDRKIPWSLVIGNHDHEHDMKRKDIIPYLQQKPYFLGCNGPDDVFGYGNYILPIKSSKNDKTATNLYCFDSNAYVEDKEYGHYDWIRFSQIQWYREQSQMIKKTNGDKNLPALAFFHIPLPEYDELYNTKKVIGEKNESVCSPKVNSGLFCSFIEMQDVMGVFVGHDHDDNYIGELRKIALAYGGVSGLDAYGDFERGGRVIELTEGERKFKTWIRDIHGAKLLFHYPHNNLYPTASTVFLPATELNNPKQGVSYNYYEGNFVSAKDILKESPKKGGNAKNFTLEAAEIDDHFAFEFNTYIKIPEKGKYEFKLLSDDGTILNIDGKEIINNDGSHSKKEKRGTVGLDKGFHKIKLLYFEDTSNIKLQLGITGINMEYKKIPDSMLFFE